MIITLKDGSTKEYSSPMSVLDIAKDISEGLGRMATAGEVNGEVVDLRHVVDQDCSLSILTANDPEGLAAYRHTTSHIMAQAIKRLYPQAKLAIGPSIADGFYYDIDIEGGFTPEDLEKIEGEMKKIIKEALPLKRFTKPREEAIAFMKATESTGLALDYELKRGKKKLACVSTAFTQFKKLGAERYKEALEILVTAWGGDMESLRGETVQGICRFVDLYYGEFDPHRLVLRLRRVDPLTIYREGKAMGVNMPASQKYLYQVFRIYNGSSKVHSLPLKF